MCAVWLLYKNRIDGELKRVTPRRDRVGRERGAVPPICSNSTAQKDYFSVLFTFLSFKYLLCCFVFFFFIKTEKDADLKKNA